MITNVTTAAILWLAAVAFGLVKNDPQLTLVAVMFLGVVGFTVWFGRGRPERASKISWWVDGLFLGLAIVGLVGSLLIWIWDLLTG